MRSTNETAWRHVRAASTSPPSEQAAEAEQQTGKACAHDGAGHRGGIYCYVVNKCVVGLVCKRPTSYPFEVQRVELIGRRKSYCLCKCPGSAIKSIDNGSSCRNLHYSL